MLYALHILFGSLHEAGAFFDDGIPVRKPSQHWNIGSYHSSFTEP